MVDNFGVFFMPHSLLTAYRPRYALSNGTIANQYDIRYNHSSRKCV